MKKIIGSHRETLPPVTLYLDEIERIVDVMKEVSTDVKFSSGDIELVDLSEMQKLPSKTIHTLSLTIREPYVSLVMEPGRIWLYIAKDDPISRGIFEKIKSIINKQKRKLACVVYDWWPIIPSLGSWPLYLPNVLSKTGIIIYLIVFPLLSILWAWAVYRESCRNYTIIRIVHRKDEVSFWQRNKDAIIVNIITSGVAGLFGFIVGRFFQ